MKTKAISLLLFLGIWSVKAQEFTEQSRAKTAFFSLSVGAGVLVLEENDKAKFSFAPTLGYKGGYMISDKTALVLLAQAAAYKNKDRNKTRGTGVLTLGPQFWILDKWWVHGGLGFGIETPAMPAKNEIWNLGFPALDFSTGYQILKRDKFSVDVHTIFLLGRSEIYKSSSNGTIYFSGVAIAVNM